jgi:DNA primase
VPTPQITFLEKALGRYYITGTEALFKCPFCDHHKPKLTINTDTYQWHCWVCKKKGGNIYALLKQSGKRDCIPEYSSVFKDFRVDKEAVNKKKEELETFKIDLPEDFIPLTNINEQSVYGKRVLSYLSNRGIDRDDILFYKLGTSFSGEYKDRIIYPSFDKTGHVNFYTGRTITNAFLKYLTPKTPKFYKNSIIINELSIDWTKPVVVVEGFVDLIKTNYANTVPLFGSSVSKSSKLFSELMTHKSEVILALDSDAKLTQDDIAKKLLRCGLNVYTIDVAPFSDVGEMPKGEFSIRLQNAKIITETNLLRDKIRARIMSASI